MVKSLWQVIAFLMLVQIAPASVCCLLPDAFGGEDTCCVPDSGAPLPGAPELPAPCPSSSMAHSQLPTGLQLPAAPMVEQDHLAAILLKLHLLAAQHAVKKPSLTSTAPPEMRTQWAFVSRAALPGRWPSILA